MSSKKMMEAGQKALDERWAVLRATLSSDELVKVIATEQANKILRDAGVAHWLFAEHACLPGSEAYNQYNSLPLPFEQSGALSEAGNDFAQNHSAALCFHAINSLRGSQRNLPDEELMPYFMFLASQYGAYLRDLTSTNG